MTTTIFDDVDVFILANMLSAKQLQNEAQNAEREAYIADHCRFSDASFPWDDYARACREALEWQCAGQKQVSTKAIPGRVDVDALKARVDIVNVIGRCVKLRKTGRKFAGLCPFHRDRKSPSLVVYPADQSFHCFGCQAHGDVIEFVMRAENTDFRGAVAILEGYNGPCRS